MAILRVSRHRLSECPACRAHIQIEDDWRATGCPFCGAQLVDAAQRPKADLFYILRSVAGTTGSLVAASLLGLGLIACETADTNGLGGVQIQDASARGDGSIVDRGTVDSGTVDSGAVDTGMIDSGEPPIVPLYGIAPQPEPADAGIEPAPDATAEPDYGIPPILEDAGSKDA